LQVFVISRVHEEALGVDTSGEGVGGEGKHWDAVCLVGSARHAASRRGNGCLSGDGAICGAAIDGEAVVADGELLELGERFGRRWNESMSHMRQFANAHRFVNQELLVVIAHDVVPVEEQGEEVFLDEELLDDGAPDLASEGVCIGKQKGEEASEDDVMVDGNDDIEAGQEVVHIKGGWDAIQVAIQLAKPHLQLGKHGIHTIGRVGIRLVEAVVNEPT